MCNEMIPEGIFQEDIIKRPAGVTYDTPARPTHIAVSWTTFQKEAKDQVEKLHRNNRHCGLLAGRDFSWPDALGHIDPTSFYDHLSGKHGDDCSCLKGIKPCVIYIRVSSKAKKQDQSLANWAEQAIRLARSKKLVPVAIFWDKNSGTKFGSDSRPKLWDAIDMTLAPGMHSLVVPCMSRMGRCINCLLEIAKLISRNGKLIGHPDLDFDSDLRLDDLKTSRGHKNLFVPMARAQAYIEQLKKYVHNSISDYQRKMYTNVERKTFFYESRRLTKQETDYRTNKDRLPVKMFRTSGAEKEAQEMLTKLKSNPVRKQLQEWAKSEKLTTKQLVKDLMHPRIAGFPDDDGQIEVPEAAVMTPHNWIEWCDLIQEALQEENPIEKTQDVVEDFAKEFGVDGMHHLSAASYGFYCVADFQGGQCGFATDIVRKKERTPGEPKVIAKCRNLVTPHEREYPRHYMAQIMEDVRSRGACLNCHAYTLRYRYKRLTYMERNYMAKYVCESCEAEQTTRVQTVKHGDRKINPEKRPGETNLGSFR